MAIKRADIRKILGETEITDSQMSDLMNLIHEEVDAIKEDRDDLQRKLDAAEKNDKSSEWESKYNKEHDAFEKYKSDQAAKETRSTKEAALKTLLSGSNLSEAGQEVAFYSADFDAIELDDKNGIKDGAKYLESVHEKWAKYVTEKKQNPTQTPGAGAGGGGNNTFDSMSLADKMAYANNNPDAPEVKKWLNS